jgi:hypothetical protein
MLHGASFEVELSRLCYNAAPHASRDANMRFQVSYPSGTMHEVELAGSVAVLGRDPGCDLVLNDSRCSRRHAVVEDGPDGLVIRDSASANGIQVNGRRVERSPLRPGDTVRLGDVQLKVLPEVEATVIVALGDLELGPAVEFPPPAPPPAAPAPEGPTAPAGPTAGPSSDRATARTPAAARQTLIRPAGRPLTVNVLVALWLATTLAAPAAGILFTARTGPGRFESALVLAGSLLLGVASGVIAAGLRALAPWARHLQIAIATLGLLVCPFSLASATVLLYLLRPEVRRAFETEGRGRGRTGAGSAELTFALSLLGMLVLGLLVTALALTYLYTNR